MTEKRFGFGRNWKAFSRKLDERRIASSVENVKRLLNRTDLSGLRFLDIGSGSGLSSIAALRLGAKVFAFDYDQDSVEASSSNLAAFSEKQDQWSVEQGSALDPEYMGKIGTFDVVYSWGVLHHTGNMWGGIELAAQAVKPGGQLAIALYNDQGGASRRWLFIKKLYVHSPSFIRFLLACFCGLYFEGRSALIRLVRLQNPLPFADWRRKKEARGMSVWHDIVDWVGGYPFEVAKPEDVFNFLKQRGYNLEYMVTCAGGHGCNEYLFTKTRKVTH